MTQKVFVPITDEILYEHPERIHGPLVPFSPGMACLHWLKVEVMTEQEYAQRGDARRGYLSTAPRAA